MNGDVILSEALAGHGIFKHPERLRFYLWLLFKTGPGGKVCASPKAARQEAGVTAKQYRLWIDYLCKSGLMAKADTGKGTVLIAAPDYCHKAAGASERRKTPSPTSNKAAKGKEEAATPTVIKEDDLDFGMFMDFFNRQVRGTSIRPIRLMTDKRKAMVRARLRDYDKQTLATAVHLAVSSDFLSGRSGKWCASFDWIFNASNFIKVIERTYDSQGFNTQHNKSACKAEVGTNGIGQVASAILQRVASEKAG